MKKNSRKEHRTKKGKRYLALLLSVCLIGTMLPVTARAETGETQESGYEQEEENASVSENDTADNESEDEEDTPDNASEDGEDTPDNASGPEDDPAPSDDEEQTKPDEKDEIEDDAAITITAWEWIDEEDIIDPKTGNMALPFANKNCPAYFDDVVALLPTQILATVENAEDAESESEETITLEEWSCEEYPKEGAYTGSYTFATTLPEGYVLSDEAKALTVLVELGGAQTYESAESETVGDFTVTGGTKDTDYTYENNVLTIKSDTPVTIANTDPNTATSDRIEVADGVSANITLAGVNINAEPAFKIADDSTGDVTITLADGSVNTLKSGYGFAGLQKNGEYSETLGKLTIQGNTGTLTANGGNYGAGIGGGNNKTGSNITISGGTVTATSYHFGAGIGGGRSGTGSYITISGGTVTATGGIYGAGIGGGEDGTGSNITINGGTVTATGGENGAGIGGGEDGTGSNITISGGTVTATGVEDGAGIGGGFSGSGSNIEISG